MFPPWYQLVCAFATYAMLNNVTFAFGEVMSVAGVVIIHFDLCQHNTLRTKEREPSSAAERRAQQWKCKSQHASLITLLLSQVRARPPPTINQKAPRAFFSFMRSEAAPTCRRHFFNKLSLRFNPRLRADKRFPHILARTHIPVCFFLCALPKLTPQTHPQGAARQVVFLTCKNQNYSPKFAQRVFTLRCAKKEWKKRTPRVRSKRNPRRFSALENCVLLSCVCVVCVHACAPRAQTDEAYTCELWLTPQQNADNIFL